MKFIKKMCAGIIIGAAAILPGVSGGVLAATLGVYEPIMQALSGFFKDVRKNFLYLLPLAVGGVFGFLAVARLIGRIMDKYEAEALFVFSGLVLGGLPSLFKTANRGGFKKRYLLVLVLALFSSFFLGAISKIPIPGNFLKYFTGGILYSFGSVVPGVSASFLLINMGIYKNVILSFESPGIFVPFLLGFSAMTVLLVRGVSWLFSHFRGYALYASIGLLLASIISVAPPITKPILDIPLFLAGLFAGFFFLSD